MRFPFPVVLACIALAPALVLAPGCNGTPPAGTSAGAGTSTAAPTILAGPASESVPAGQAAIFTVTATGAAPLTFQWSRANPNGPPVPLASSNDPAIILPQVAASDSGATFMVTVSNSQGSLQSASATLTVVASDTAAVVPASATVTAGVPCSASVQTNPGATAYLWTLTGAQLAAGTGATGSSVSFIPAADGSVGLSCLVTEADGSQVTAGTALPILPAAPFVITVAAYVTDGSTQVYTASVPAVPGYTYSWSSPDNPADVDLLTTTSNAITFQIPVPPPGSTSTTTARSLPQAGIGTGGATGAQPYLVHLSVTESDPATTFTAQTSSTITVLPGEANAQPVITLSPSSVTPGETGCSVAAVPGALGQCLWTLTSGQGTSIASDPTLPGITYNVGPDAAGNVTFNLQVTPGVAGLPAQTAQVSVPITATPSYSITPLTRFLEAGAPSSASLNLAPDDTVLWQVKGATATDLAANPVQFTSPDAGSVQLSAQVSHPGLGTFDVLAITLPVVGGGGAPVVTGPGWVEAGSGTYLATASPGVSNLAGDTFSWTISIPVGTSVTLIDPAGGLQNSGSTSTSLVTAGPSVQFQLSANATGPLTLNVTTLDLAGQSSPVGTFQANVASPASTPPTLNEVLSHPVSGILQVQVSNPVSGDTYQWSASAPAGTGTPALALSGTGNSMLTITGVSMNTPVTITCLAVDPAGFAQSVIESFSVPP